MDQKQIILHQIMPETTLGQCPIAETPDEIMIDIGCPFSPARLFQPRQQSARREQQTDGVRFRGVGHNF